MSEKRHTYKTESGVTVTYNDPSTEALRSIIQGLIKFGII